MHLEVGQGVLGEGVSPWQPPGGQRGGGVVLHVWEGRHHSPDGDPRCLQLHHRHRGM